jgi:hypothetical protein
MLYSMLFRHHTYTLCAGTFTEKVFLNVCLPLLTQSAVKYKHHTRMKGRFKQTNAGPNRLLCLHRFLLILLAQQNL